jgi:hypothetical protein
MTAHLSSNAFAAQRAHSSSQVEIMIDSMAASYFWNFREFTMPPKSYRLNAGHPLGLFHDRALSSVYHWSVGIDAVPSLCTPPLYGVTISGEKSELTSAGEEKRLRCCVSYSQSFYLPKLWASRRPR